MMKMLEEGFREDLIFKCSRASGPISGSPNLVVSKGWDHKKKIPFTFQRRTNPSYPTLSLANLPFKGFRVRKQARLTTERGIS